MKLASLGLVNDQSEERLFDLVGQLQDGEQSWGLFSGAGLSAGIGLPDWSGLAKGGAERFGVEVPADIHCDNYPVLIGEALGATSHDEFWAFMQEQLCQPIDPSPVLVDLMSLPFKVFLTTNLDCTIRKAHDDLDGVTEPRVLAYPNLPPLEVANRRLVYLHGRCPCDGDGTPLSEDTSVLTRHAYDMGYNQESFLERSLKAVFSSWSVLFVGCSLDDHKIGDIIDRARAMEEGLLSREGSQYVAPTRYALFPWTRGEVEAGEDLDLSFPGLYQGVKPIYFHRRPRDEYWALAEVVSWLKRTIPQGLEITGPQP